MLAARRLPRVLVVGTFALSGLVATAGVTSVAMGVGGSDEVTCPGVNPEHPAGRILSCLGASTAYISTPIGSGSGLVLPGGYLLTNAHVVDPFDKVDVTLGKDKQKDVKVVGVDLFADIAVLGPITTDAKPVHLIDPSGLDKGDDLFLVGYPGEANTEDLEPTIADGILSRTRHSKLFDLGYLQTDASIGGGQSGGALVDIDGDVVGISSLRFADSFALALSGADAQTAVDKILAGKGSPYVTWPGGTPAPSSTLHLSADEEDPQLAIPAAPEARTIDVTIPSDLPVAIESGDLETGDGELAGNLHAIAAEELDVPLSAVAGATQDQLTQYFPDEIDLAQQLSPGRFRFKVPAGRHVYLDFSTNRSAAFDVPITVSIPSAPVVPAPTKDLKVGDVIDTTISSATAYDTYRLTLTKGQKVQIYAGSPSGDMEVLVHGPGLGEDDEKDFDDSRAGLYGVDVDETFTAPADATYVLEVGEVDSVSTGYHFAVTPAKATTT